MADKAAEIGEEDINPTKKLNFVSRSAGNMNCYLAVRSEGERDAVVIGINVYFFGFSRVFFLGNKGKRGIILPIFLKF